MTERFKQYAESLRREFPSSEPHLAVLSLGTVILDLRIGSRVYVFGHYPDLSRLAVFGPDGQKIFTRFDEAASWLLSLLKETSPQQPGSAKASEACREARELRGSMQISLAKRAALMQKQRDLIQQVDLLMAEQKEQKKQVKFIPQDQRRPLSAVA